MIDHDRRDERIYDSRHQYEPRRGRSRKRSRSRERGRDSHRGRESHRYEPYRRNNKRSGGRHPRSNNVSMRNTSNIPCRFFASENGCKKGDKCDFLHGDTQSPPRESGEIREDVNYPIPSRVSLSI